MDEGLKLNRKQREAVIAALDDLYAKLPDTLPISTIQSYAEARRIMAAPATTAPLYGDD